MNAAEVKSFLTNLGKKINSDFPCLNMGGCCVYAALIAEKLKENGVNANGVVVACFDSPFSVAVARKGVNDIGSLREWNDNGVAFNHVVLEFTVEGKRFRYDSAGVVEAKNGFRGDPIYSGRLKLKELQALATSDGWSTRFDRKDIPKLKKIIDIEFASFV
jgi:hypothetical protein